MTDDWADDLSVADRAVLDPVRGVLADEDTWSGPPPGLRERVLAEAADADTGVAPVRSRRRWVAPVLAGLGAAAALVAVALVLGLGGEDEVTGPVEEYAAAGTSLAPDATAQVEVESLPAGDAITLVITGLPPAPEGRYYSAWVRGQRGTVPVGTFHWREGGVPIELWSGVDTAAYPQLFVTLQDESAPSTPPPRSSSAAPSADS